MLSVSGTSAVVSVDYSGIVSGGSVVTSCKVVVSSWVVSVLTSSVFTACGAIACGGTVFFRAMFYSPLLNKQIC